MLFPARSLAVGMSTAAVPEPLRRAPTSVVSDALDAHLDDDRPGGVLAGRPPAHPDHRAVGRARPVVFERADGGERTNFPYAMLEALAADEVVVIDGVAGTSAWGGMASRLAANAGVAGVVVARGGYRDVETIRTGSFPVFGGQTTPRTGQRRVVVASTGARLAVDGVSVAPGDVVVADATGVVVVPRDVEAGVADATADLLEEEARLEDAIDAGATLDELRADERTF